MGSILIGKNINVKRDKWLIIYTFLAIFQPPLLPIGFVYILGTYTLIWLYFYKNKTLSWEILHASKIYWGSKIFLLFFLYIIIVGTLDMILIEPVSTLSTRLRSINQLIILSFLEFACILYLLIHFTKRNYQLRDIITIIILAGILQGLCAILAFLVPSIRNLFMIFGDKDLYSNEFFMERRGYGFSMNLIDTFGYGMGLIAGYAILIHWTNKRLLLATTILLVLFTIAVNARTGIIVFGIALIIKIFSNKGIGEILMTVVVVTLIGSIFFNKIPTVLEAGQRSSNPTISWISNSFIDMYYLIEISDSSAKELDEVGFLSNFIDLPSNNFELLFGTGHHVYDTGDSLGFRTDIGYLNLFWEFGIIGSGVLLICLFWLFIKPFFNSKNQEIKIISLFNSLTYGLVLMKAILIGYNSGGFVNYLMTFSLYYCMYKNKSIIK